MTDAGRKRARVSLGHPSRLSLHPTARWLVSGHLVVFALSLEDEEIVAMIAEAWNLGARASAITEVVLSLLLLVIWGVLTLGWVRFAGTLREKRRPQ